MLVVCCDTCAKVIGQGDFEAKYPVFVEGSIYPKMISVCRGCSDKVSDFLNSLEHLPYEVVLPLKARPVEEEVVVAEEEYRAIEDVDTYGGSGESE